MTDRASFREGMRRLAATVCVITTGQAGERFGCTATAVCSLSDQPPSLLVCLNRQSQTARKIDENRRFAVNVLGGADQEIAASFAQRCDAREKFANGEWADTPSGVPLLRSALASFACDVDDIIESGSHWMMVGRIITIGLGGAGQGSLLYGNGSYGEFTTPSYSALAATGS